MKLLLTGAFNYSHEQLKLIENLGYDITFVQNELEKLNINVSEFDAVVCNGLFLHNDIDDFLSLRFVQITSAGYDRVPVKKIKANSINLCNARGVYSAPMAEWAVLKALEIYKNSRLFYKNQSNNIWLKDRTLLELTDKNVAVFGAGDIGTKCAKRFSAFDANVIGIDISDIQSEYFNEKYLISDIEKVLKKSDIVILMLPLTDMTYHLFDEKMFSKFKDNSVLINVSRGAVIDENALINAIDNNKFLGVALDVFENEPLGSDSPLWNKENVLISPHNSFVSDKTNERLFNVIYSNLKEFNN